MNYTTNLFSEPSFFEGVARLVDFGSTLNEYNISNTSEQADEKALKSDWYAIGEDFKKVVNDYGK